MLAHGCAADDTRLDTSQEEGGTTEALGSKDSGKRRYLRDSASLRTLQLPLRCWSYTCRVIPFAEKLKVVPCCSVI